MHQKAAISRVYNITQLSQRAEPVYHIKKDSLSQRWSQFERRSNGAQPSARHRRQLQPLPEHSVAVELRMLREKQGGRVLAGRVARIFESSVRAGWQQE